MADTEQPETQSGAEQRAPADQSSEESAWPSWLSWVLVIAAGVFGGYLLGGSTKGTESADMKLAAERRQFREMVDLLKAQHQVAMEMGQRASDQTLKSFCREMIYTGLFRDKLDYALAQLDDKLNKVIQKLGASTSKPQDLPPQTVADLKEISDGLKKIAEDYGKSAEAAKRIAEIGSTDQKFQAIQKQLAYLYYDRAKQLMKDAAAGNPDALRQASFCRAITGQLDPKIAAELDKQFPQLAAASQPASGPASQSPGGAQP